MADHYLVSNGTHLYRYGAHLLRTPITIRLQPDERAFYAVAGEYGSSNWPTGGFKDISTYSNVLAIGEKMTRAAFNPIANQHWRAVTTSHDPETVWYQGGYATTAPSLTAGPQTCEAFAQFSAYHFTIPQGLAELPVNSVKVGFTNGGGVQCYASPAGRSPQNVLLKGYDRFTDFNIGFCVTPDLIEPATMCNVRPYDDVDLLTDGGECRGARDLWGFGSSTRDGGIPTLTTPVARSYDMSAATREAFASGGGAWIVPHIHMDVAGTGNYRPLYVNPTAGWWACASLWGLTVEVTIG